MLIKIAWRNIWRNTKRSLIIIGAVTIGLWAGIFLIAFYNGMIEQRINSAIAGEISHLQAHHPLYSRDFDIRYTLPDGTSMQHTIAAASHVHAASGRLIIKGMIASANGSSGISINGIRPEDEAKLTALPDKIVEGTYFVPEKRNEILVSQRLLKKLKLNLNKKAILTFQDQEGNLASAAFRVTGIFSTVNPNYDDLHVFVDLSDVDTLAGTPGQINELAILLDQHESLDTFQAMFRHRYPDLDIQNWKELSPELGLMVSAGDQMVIIFMGIILLALAFGIVNTMMMAILERTREIGMLMALGMNKWKVFLMILSETLLLILAGCPSGIALALISVAITSQTGIDLGFFTEAYTSFGYASVVFPSLTWRHFIMMMLLVLLTAILSGLYPARKALSLKPAESIKK